MFQSGNTVGTDHFFPPRGTSLPWEHLSSYQKILSGGWRRSEPFHSRSCSHTAPYPGDHRCRRRALCPSTHCPPDRKGPDRRGKCTTENKSIFEPTFWCDTPASNCLASNEKRESNCDPWESCTILRPESIMHSITRLHHTMTLW